MAYFSSQKILQLEKFWKFPSKFRKGKGHGKDRCPLWVGRKGKGKLSNSDWKERKGDAFRKKWTG